MERNLQPIYPRSRHLLPEACTSCGGDVRCDSGFADLNGTPFRAFFCPTCTSIAIGPMEAARRLDAVQLRELRELGVLAPIIAAMRCYVESKLGEEVEIPEELA